MPTDAAAGLREAMAEHGIVTDAPIVADGALHRIQVEGDKRDSRNGWYVLHADEPAAGAFGSWRTGVSATWCAGSNGRLSDVERREWQRKAKATRDRQQKEARRRRQRASDRAAKLWERSKPADPEHPYLRRKGVGAHGIRQRGDVLLIPVRGADGGLRGLQRIYPSGSKMFAAGTEATGGYFGIGSPAGTVVIAEGFATAATIHEATGHAVAVAYSAGNLEPVAKALRGKLGADVRIIIAADNDNPTPNDPNPGLTAATKAARAVGALLAVPDDRPADFNDVAGERGPDAVRATIDSARAPVDEPAVQRELEALRVRREARRRLDAESSDSPEARVWTMAELQADPSMVELPAAVAARIAWKGRATVLAGREKLGKSTAMGAVGAAVSAGRPWLDEPTTAGHVLWCAEESPGDVVRRLRRFGANPENVTIMSWGADPIAEIRAEAERLRPALVVIDTLQAVAEHARPDSGRASDWAAIMRPLVRIARDTGAAVVILHHARKSDGTYRDSTEIAAAVDVVMTMSGTETDTIRRLSWKGRYGRGAFAVRLAGDRYVLLDSEEDGEELAEQITRYVEAHPGTGSKAVERGVRGRGIDVLRTLGDLVAAGKIADEGTENRHRYRVLGPAPKPAPESGAPSSENDPTAPALRASPTTGRGNIRHFAPRAQQPAPTTPTGVGAVAERGSPEGEKTAADDEWPPLWKLGDDIADGDEPEVEL